MLIDSKKALALSRAQCAHTSENHRGDFQFIHLPVPNTVNDLLQLQNYEQNKSVPLNILTSH